jgi:hypothetical protein
VASGTKFQNQFILIFIKLYGLMPVVNIELTIVSELKRILVRTLAISALFVTSDIICLSIASSC